jgi:hypothetical protein
MCLAWICLGAADLFQLTILEARACEAVIRHAESGAPIEEDDARIARSLFAAMLPDDNPS